jgi:hypothetical protein
MKLAVLFVALAALFSASLLAADTAAAGKPGGGGKPSGGTPFITLNQPDPHLGDSVTFATSGGSRVALACYQGGIGDMVYSADQPTGTAFLLGANSPWSSAGGEALCYAWLYSRSLSRGSAASTSFTAGGAR